MMNPYDVMGACGPFGCAPPGYNPYYGGGAPLAYGGGGWGGGGWPGQSLAIVGQQPMVQQPQYAAAAETPVAADTPAAEQPGFMARTGDWLAAENTIVPLRNRTILGLAAVTGLGVYGYSAGWFTGRDQDFNGNGRRRTSGGSSGSRDTRSRSGNGSRSGSSGNGRRRSGASSRDFFW